MTPAVADISWADLAESLIKNMANQVGNRLESPLESNLVQ